MFQVAPLPAAPVPSVQLLLVIRYAPYVRLLVGAVDMYRERLPLLTAAPDGGKLLKRTRTRRLALLLVFTVMGVVAP
ncbi:MAG: hypothetical protein DME06_05135 [Candidatus Rokuibacteriota bacterium]|nr:MAG: hypothetical protein DME06_05135 [Candidatus Rokubacteria bacterium]